MSTIRRVAVVLFCIVPAGATARADVPERLRVSWPLDGAITGAALATWGASELAKGALAPSGCRVCGVDGLDASVRNGVLWSNRGTAATLSDVLQVGVPLAIAGYDGFAAPTLERSSEDALLISEAIAISGVLTQAAKYSVARVRPYAYYGRGDTGRDDHVSFWSGHTVVAFAAVAAGGNVARLRGYHGWPWVYAVGFGGAALTGYFRMAADAHWFTDVLASAAVGTTVGLLVPWLHRSAGEGTAFQIVPGVGGLAVVGVF